MCPFFFFFFFIIIFPFSQPLSKGFSILKFFFFLFQFHSLFFIFSFYSYSYFYFFCSFSFLFTTKFHPTFSLLFSLVFPSRQRVLPPTSHDNWCILMSSDDTSSTIHEPGSLVPLAGPEPQLEQQQQPNIIGPQPLPNATSTSASQYVKNHILSPEPFADTFAILMLILHLPVWLTVLIDCTFIHFLSPSFSWREIWRPFRFISSAFGDQTALLPPHPPIPINHQTPPNRNQATRKTNHLFLKSL